MRMKQACLRLLFVLGLLGGAGAAFAQADLAGDWRGKLAVDANTVLPVQFLFTKKPDGSYAAVLNSLENSFIKNVAASSVSWKDGALKVEVPALSGSYSGTLKDERFEGQWSQTGSKPIALTLARPPKPTKAEVDALLGRWQGTLPGPAQAAVIFEFKQDSKGDVTGSLSVPTQGALGMPFANLEIGAGEVAFKIPQIGSEYRGAVSGSAMTGFFRQGSAPQGGAPLDLTKSAIATSERLTLAGEAWNALYGDWRGKLGQFTAALHFTVNGLQQVGFLEVVEQKAMLPITAVTVNGKKVVITVTTAQGEFSGELTGKTTLTGQWTQGGRSTPVTWTRQ
jgi:hypothetical protein